MASFLQNSGSKKAEMSYAQDHHYVLGMKRITLADYQQDKIARREELQSLCLMHGEFHNYQSTLQESLPEDTHCDGDLDLALQLYHRHGPEFGRKFNGLFSIVVLDQRNKSLIIANDRFGLAHQVYWTIVNGRFCFATHLKTLLACPDIRREIDPEGLNLFLKYSYIPSPWTIFKGIKKLPPGHLLVFKDGTATHDTYWELGLLANPITEIEEAIPAYKQVLQESISKRLNGNVGIFLSGGLDSSANVALAAECTESQLKTFSIGFKDQTFDESPYARIVAHHFNTEHFEYTITGEEIEDLPKLIWNLEEPYFEFGLFLTYLGMAAAQKEVDVILGGEGADQMFGTGGFAGALPAALRYLLLRYHLLWPASKFAGLLKGGYFYDRDNWAFKFRLLWNRAINLNHWYFYGYDENELTSLHQDHAVAHVPDIFSEDGNNIPSSFPGLYNETQIGQDLNHYVNENVMVKSGRMADMLDLTLRESYLDTEVADFLVSLDFRLKRSGDLMDHLRGKFKTKFLHRKAMEDLLPNEIMTKPKQGGFVPVMIFLKDPELRKRIYRHLLNSETMKQYFRTDYLKTIFSNYESMQGQKIYWHNFYNSKANRILFLLTFDIWHAYYMQNSPLDIEPPSLSDYLSMTST
jgi:asparagine synthase (glutamine-hydrolysing)